jgi:hypothetical protein
MGLGVAAMVFGGFAMGCELDDDEGDATGGVDDRVEVGPVLRLQDNFFNEDLQECTTYPASGGKFAPGADIDAVVLESGWDGELHNATQATLDTAAEACAGGNDFGSATAALGAPDGQYVSLNGGDLLIEFDVPIREGDLVMVYEVDAQAGMSGETIAGAYICESATDTACAKKFDELGSTGSTPIALQF